MSEKMFGGEGSEQYQAVWDALHACGQENCISDLPDDADETAKIYDWLESVPRTSLTCELVNKLHEMGFKIVKG